MSFVRRAVAFLLSLGFLIVAMCAAVGLLWALVDLKSASRMLGSKFSIVRRIALTALKWVIIRPRDSPIDRLKVVVPGSLRNSLSGTLEARDAGSLPPLHHGIVPALSGSQPPLIIDSFKCARKPSWSPLPDGLAKEHPSFHATV